MMPIKPDTHQNEKLPPRPGRWSVLAGLMQGLIAWLLTGSLFATVVALLLGAGSWLVLTRTSHRDPHLNGALAGALTGFLFPVATWMHVMVYHNPGESVPKSITPSGYLFITLQFSLIPALIGAVVGFLIAVRAYGMCPSREDNRQSDDRDV